MNTPSHDGSVLSGILAQYRDTHNIVGAPKVDFGRMLITPAAQSTTTFEGRIAALAQHEVGLWGLCDPDDAARNDAALDAPDCWLLSVWLANPKQPTSERFYLITETTEHGRVTTLLLAEER